MFGLPEIWITGNTCWTGKIRENGQETQSSTPFFVNGSSCTKILEELPYLFIGLLTFRYLFTNEQGIPLHLCLLLFCLMQRLGLVHL